MRPGKRNLITDVAGLYVGNASNENLKSGTTVLVGDRPFTAAVDVMGGAPGTRETELLAPDKLVEQVDALVLSGGSAFGLDAASGVMDGLRDQRRGYTIGSAIVPIVPAAILFDLLNGGDKGWKSNPYRGLGLDAFNNVGPEFELGTHGAGVGGTTVNLKGGLGSASILLANGFTVGAIVAVNAVGGANPTNQANFWAGAWEVGQEFGGLGPASKIDPFENPAGDNLLDTNPGLNTTIAIVATDAKLTKAQAKRMAVAAQDGIARAFVPSHTLLDGDLIFAVSTNEHDLEQPVPDQLKLGHAAATCLSRAIARGVYHATAAENDTLPTWQDKWGHP